MHPETFFRVLGPRPWRVGYVQPSRRPADGRYGENPNRLYKHEQFQVILKPPPADIQDLYLDSLKAIGIDPVGARRALRGGQLGVADARRVGHRLAGAARRPGDHASSPTSSRRAGSTSRPSRARSPTGSSASRCTCRTSTTCTTCAGRRTRSTATCATRRSSSSRATPSSWPTSSCTGALFDSALARGLAPPGDRRRPRVPARLRLVPQELARLQRARRARGDLGDASAPA